MCEGGDIDKSGFHFENVRSVSIKGVEFLNCGHPNVSSSWVPINDGDAGPVDAWSALSFANSRDIVIENVLFNNSKGYSTSLINCQGNLSFNSLVYQNNQLKKHYSKGEHKVLLKSKILTYSILSIPLSRVTSGLTTCTTCIEMALNHQLLDIFLCLNNVWIKLQTPSMSNNNNIKIISFLDFVIFNFCSSLLS